jgi:hypothetical protein
MLTSERYDSEDILNGIILSPTILRIGLSALGIIVPRLTKFWVLWPSDPKEGFWLDLFSKLYSIFLTRIGDDDFLCISWYYGFRFPYVDDWWILS